MSQQPGSPPPFDPDQFKQDVLNAVRRQLTPFAQNDLPPLVQQPLINSEGWFDVTFDPEQFTQKVHPYTEMKMWELRALSGGRKLEDIPREYLVQRLLYQGLSREHAYRLLQEFGLIVDRQGEE